jgi:hypothetical protein
MTGQDPDDGQMSVGTYQGLYVALVDLPTAYMNQIIYLDSSQQIEQVTLNANDHIRRSLGTSDCLFIKSKPN